MKLYAWFHAKHDGESVDYEGNHVTNYQTAIFGPVESFQEIFDSLENWNNHKDDDRYWEIVATWDVDAVEKSAPWTLSGITQGIVDGVEASFLNKRIPKVCLKESYECKCPSCSSKPYRKVKNEEK